MDTRAKYTRVDHPYSRLREKPLSVRVKTMHTTFHLRTRGAELEAHLTRLDAVLESVDVLDADILERVLNTCVEVGQESGDRSFVLYVARYTLSDLYCG